MPDELLTLRKAAALAGYRDPAVLRQAIQRGTLAATKRIERGQVVNYVTEADLRAYLAQRPPWHQDGRNLTG